MGAGFEKGLKKRYRAVIFDFDGTIVDSFLGITLSMQTALKAVKGIEISELEQLKRFVGPPLYDTFRTAFFMSEEDAAKAVGYFRKRFSEVGYAECEVYEGVEKMLVSLRRKGIKTAIASSKADDMLKKVAAAKGVDIHFDVIAGISDVVKHETKAAVIGKVLEMLSVAPEEAVMVGDRMYDAEGAKAAGVDFIGALWAGYGSREEFLAYPNVLLADSIGEVSFMLEAAEH